MAFKTGSDVYGLPSRDSARIAKSTFDAANIGIISEITKKMEIFFYFFIVFCIFAPYIIKEEVLE